MLSAPMNDDRSFYIIPLRFHKFQPVCTLHIIYQKKQQQKNSVNLAYFIKSNRFLFTTLSMVYLTGVSEVLWILQNADAKFKMYILH